MAESDGHHPDIIPSPRPTHTCALSSIFMAPESDEYLAVLKASYDYDPQSEDEVAIKEDQLLFLLERVDDESVSYVDHRSLRVY